MGDDSAGECGVPLFNRFKMPANGNSLFWYSHDYGSVHFVMLSSEHNNTRGSVQHTWFENDLKGVNRSLTPWVVVASHRPIYNSEKYDSDFETSLGMRAEFEYLLLEYSVDLYWAGHYHSYERVCPVNNGACVPHGEGTVHVTIGCAGASLDSVGLYGYTWSQFFEDDWGIGRVTIANESAMHWEYVRNADKKVVDDAWIYKKGHGVVKTLQGCSCKQGWGTGVNETGNFYTCMNPYAEVGNWCYTEDGCRSTATTDKPRTASWDFCDKAPVKTETGCTCLSPWKYQGYTYYGCSDPGFDDTLSEKYEWCYTGDGCGTKGAGGSWDKC